MGDPGLLQELPDIPALLPEGGGDREQSAAADGTAGGLDAKADFALDDQLAQCSLGSTTRCSVPSKCWRIGRQLCWS